MSILDAIGNTSLVPLRRIVPSDAFSQDKRDHMAALGAELTVLGGGRPGAHRIEGIGIGRLPPHWDPDLVDGIEAVSTADAEAMARRLAAEEGMFAGTSSGANLVAALRVAARLGPGATVVTLMIDTGLKYLSGALYRRPEPSAP